MQSRKPRLLIASYNPGKLAEFRSLLGDGYELVSPSDVGLDHVPGEVGLTYADNAHVKAEMMSTLSGLVTLADDSGLEVDALKGEPGVKSARYAGNHATDEERLSLLLGKLKDVPWPRRRARFVCVICLAGHPERFRFFRGECRGYITFEPRGSNGFGYDPVFYFPKLGKTMAELSPDVKNVISHRALAAAKAKKALPGFFRGEPGK